jgi:hypothetical protein
MTRAATIVVTTLTAIVFSGCAASASDPVDGGFGAAPPTTPVDDPTTLPHESYGLTECDVDYDPGYCGDSHGP